MSTIRSYTFLLLSLVLISCQFNKTTINNENDKKSAEAVVDQFYARLAQKDISGAMHLFHPNLLMSNDSNKLKEFLNNLSGQTPILKERQLDHWDTKVVIGLDAGSSYDLYYIHKFTTGEQLKLSVKLAKDDSARIRIANFQVDPNKFL